MQQYELLCSNILCIHHLSEYTTTQFKLYKNNNFLLKFNENKTINFNQSVKTETIVFST